MSDEEKKAIEYLKRHIIPCYGRKGTIEFMLNDTVLNLIEKQSKEIEEIKETLKCTQNSWYEDTKVIEKQSKEIEELKKSKYIINCKTNEITKLTNDFVSKDKIKAKIEDILNSENSEAIEKLIEWQSLLEKE